jgi:hypothetical protein
VVPKCHTIFGPPEVADLPHPASNAACQLATPSQAFVRCLFDSQHARFVVSFAVTLFANGN